MTTIYAVDELGGTFAFLSREEAERFLVAEAWGGAANLTIFKFETSAGTSDMDAIAEIAVGLAPDVAEES